MFEATIIADSISPDAVRLTTIHVRYPRMVHSELMTHRVFSRNARSSRAVPVITLSSEDIYTPHFLKNKPGMQATEELEPDVLYQMQREWEELARHCQKVSRIWAERGMHKQWANRPLEWFSYIDVLISSTYWENFFELRRDSGAQPEIQLLAGLIYETFDQSPAPRQLNYNQWHLPYIIRDEELAYPVDTQLKISTARCARISYKPFNGDSSVQAELDRYDRLMTQRPVHASPAEHQARPDRKGKFGPITPCWERPELHGNFYGWLQHRKLIPNEAVMENYR